ncbi:pentatricopeptide repeat-containing protein At2g37310 [Quercus lobata]|uniref:pentatricopeptide repeat-containing protein At2g37310 n=1 Tax=Quercus lobata TaxID=97700 RepID=UPI00124657DA|nr:pentatricopeptide repeat-containing protein At2g37310 [Quercus lobata]
MRITKALNIRIQTASNGYVQQALQSLLAANGLDYGAYGCLIQHCTDHHLFRLGRQLHSRLVLFSVTPNNFLASKLITFYSKSNHLRDARNVFDKIPDKNIFSWNALLIGYSLNNRYLDTLKLFLSLVSSNLTDVKPDCYTISCVLKALSSLFSHSRSAKEVHCFVLRRGFDLDIFVVNALITQYSRCDEIGFARTVFDRMSERDIVSWNSMIAGYSQAGFYEECKELYREMLGSSGLRPNGMTIVSVLQACGQSHDLIFGIEVHRFINESQIDIDVSVYNAIIGLYAKCGSLDYARELFDEMSDKDEVTYGSIISGYMLHGFVDNAMDLFRNIKNPGLSTWNAVISGLVQNNRHEGVLDLVIEMQACGFKPNTVTISSILPTISCLSNLKVGKEIHAYSVKNNYDSNIYVSTAIIDTYAKSGFLHGAQRIFDQSKHKSLIIWTAIISAYAAHGDANTTLRLFNEMLNNGIRPDPVTFTAVLSACAHSGMVEEAWEIFDAMFMKYGIQPSVEHYACMVGVLSRAGRLSEAAEFVSKMPIEPSAKVWGALLNGAAVSGDVELGKFVCDHLFEIEPENTGNYIIMANLYSQAGRWEEADKTRERMKKIGLKKIPGSSWIETSGGLQIFIARDVSNGRAEEIYEILGGLLGLMREEGYVSRDELDEESVFS